MDRLALENLVELPQEPSAAEGYFMGQPGFPEVGTPLVINANYLGTDDLEVGLVANAWKPEPDSETLTRADFGFIRFEDLTPNPITALNRCLQQSDEDI